MVFILTLKIKNMGRVTQKIDWSLIVLDQLKTYLGFDAKVFGPLATFISKNTCYQRTTSLMK